MVLFSGIGTCTCSGLVWQVLGTDFLPFFVFPELLTASCGKWVLDTHRWKVDSEPKSCPNGKMCVVVFPSGS